MISSCCPLFLLWLCLLLVSKFSCLKRDKESWRRPESCINEREKEYQSHIWPDTRTSLDKALGLYILFGGRGVLLGITVSIGVRTGEAGRGCSPPPPPSHPTFPQFQKFLKFSGKMLMMGMRANVLGRKHLGSACRRLRSLTFSSSKRS